MPLDERYDPRKNDRLASILKQGGFSLDLPHVPLNREDNGVEAGIVFMRTPDDIIVVLHPKMGTGVIDHPLKTEEVTYLGPISGGDASQLSYKFQNDSSEIRNSEKDEVLPYAPGRSFTAASPGKPGRYHGFHNSNPDHPVALHITRISS